MPRTKRESTVTTFSQNDLINTREGDLLVLVVHNILRIGDYEHATDEHAESDLKAINDEFWRRERLKLVG